MTSARHPRKGNPPPAPPFSEVRTFILFLGKDLTQSAGLAGVGGAPAQRAYPLGSRSRVFTWRPVVMAALRKPVLLGLQDVAVHGCPAGPGAWTASKLGGLPVRWGLGVGVGGCW